MTSAPWPLNITYKSGQKCLDIIFDDGKQFELPAEYLRVESPSAEVQGHGAATRITVPGKRNVTITAIEEVGRYAIRIRFDDGHDTGLYSWDYLHQLGREHDKRWREYQSRLKAQGLSRDP